MSLYTFAGTEADASRIQRRFIKHFVSAPGPIADLGCGRGGFLAQLMAAGIPAVGVDASSESFEFCRKRGFNIVQDEVLPFLSSNEQALGGIFFSHVVEHLNPNEATEFFSLAHKALKTGGRMVVATPNVLDLWTMTELFWLDTTHVRPYPLPLLCQYSMQAGFRVAQTGTHGLGYRPMGRRHLPRYLWRRLIWGKEYGRSDDWILVERTQ